MPPKISLRPNTLRHLLQGPITGREFQRLPILIQFTTPLSTQHLPSSVRTFTSTPPVLKKGGKSSKKESAPASTSSSTESPDVEDPFDFSTLESGIKKSLEKLEQDLSKLRTGGRFNPEILENVRVHLTKDAKTSIRLGELAQVLPKGGRQVMVLVGEADHVKPIVSAIQGAKDLNLQPQPDAHNALQLNVPIPPPTKESRDLALTSASKVGETATVGIRNARGAMQKKLRAIELKRTARPDDLKKAHKEMEKVVEKGNADVKKMVDTARKTMEQ